MSLVVIVVDGIFENAKRGANGVKIVPPKKIFIYVYKNEYGYVARGGCEKKVGKSR
jgi:hypothetical protein